MIAETIKKVVVIAEECGIGVVMVLLGNEMAVFLSFFNLVPCQLKQNLEEVLSL
jgi:hypothetical protein